MRFDNDSLQDVAQNYFRNIRSGESILFRLNVRTSVAYTVLWSFYDKVTNSSIISNHPSEVVEEEEENSKEENSKDENSGGVKDISLKEESKVDSGLVFIGSEFTVGKVGDFYVEIKISYADDQVSILRYEINITS